MGWGMRVGLLPGTSWGEVASLGWVECGVHACTMTWSAAQCRSLSLFH
jgi:hypothetical protein